MSCVGLCYVEWICRIELIGWAVEDWVGLSGLCKLYRVGWVGGLHRVVQIVLGGLGLVGWVV